MDIHQLRSLVQDDVDAVDALIASKIQSPIILLDDLAGYVISSGGKRLRPLLVLLSSHACGYKDSSHIMLATMIEFFHTATLLHDDVVDDSTLRRGKKTANIIWGNKASILVGDYLFTQYMQLMIQVGKPDIMQMLTETSHQIGCGELQQLSNRNNPSLSIDNYLEIIRAKTSLLFAASASLGALVSDAPSPIAKALYDYGLHLGNAFQLIDDALDYCSDAQTIGKNIGDDLADGKATLPIIHAMKNGTAEQQLKIKESIQKGTLEFLPDILAAIEDTNAIDYTRSVAATEVDSAIGAILGLPDSVYKEALISLAHYAVSRDH